jgi:N-acetylmuramoyl-L-alanine amidase
MPAFIIYLIKSIACSGILYSFYRVAYYNKPHHQWSRFFLMGSVIVSLALPLVKINVPVATNNNPSAVIHLLDVVSTNKTETDEGTAAFKNTFNAGSLLIIFYASVSCVLLFLLAKGLLRIIKIYNTCPKERLNNIQTVMTAEKDTPFSFLRTIFWNSRINHNSGVGEKIFEHEKVHVHQLHSIDRLFINCALTVFWCNPFYWLIKKELIVVHEFMADKNSVKDHNPETLSEMLLVSVFPGQNFGVASSFFNSSIKRRFSMLTTFNNSRPRAIGKWLLLPLFVFLIAGFTLRKTRIVNGPVAPFTVMIDAGHGGERSGAIAPDGTKEKDLNLMIATKVRDLNKNANIKIVMTRESDVEPSLRDRVAMANNAKADAFISIHINRDESGQSGFQVYMTKNSTGYAEKSQMLGSLLSQEIRRIYKVEGELRKGLPNQGIWVLDAPEINYPSLLVECGNLLNSQDLEFVKSESNQEKIAQQILNAISQFAENKTAFLPQRQNPSAIEMLVEEGTIDIDLTNNKIAKADLSPLKMVSTRNIFKEDVYQADGSEIVFVDGIYMSDKSGDVKHVSVGRNKKLLLVSTKNVNPLETLIN